MAVHPRVVGPPAQRRARAAAGLLAALVVLAVLDLAASLAGAYGPSGPLDIAVGGGAAVALLVCYALVRGGRVTAGVILSLAVMDTAIAAYRSSESGAAETQLLYFLSVPILLGGLLLSARVAAVASLVTIAGALAFESYADTRAGNVLDSADASLTLLLLGVAVISVGAAAFAARDARLLDKRTADLEQARQALEHASAERRRMFNQIAHDLASPLTPIAFQARILETQGADAKSVAIVKRNVASLQKQVDDLKDLVRVEGGALRLAVQPCDLAQATREAVESFAETARSKGIALDVDAGNALVAACDRARVDQVLYNLLSNAIKFTPPGGRVGVAAAASDGGIAISVRDSGRGLSSEDMARLFHPFSQVHAIGEAAERGTGLGLFIARGIAQAHGGQVDVQSAGPGTGSTFTLRLPMLQEATPAGPLAA